MQHTIDRIPYSELTPSGFFANHYRLERPLLVQGVPVATQRLTPEFMKSRFADAANKELGWYDAPLVDDGGDPAHPPELVRAALRRPDVHTRALPMRAWLQPPGHTTFFHHDGNGIHGFNLQVRGRKRWTLVDAATPLRCIPFTFMALHPPSEDPSPDRHEVYDFETGPGDMLFLPRYWFHRVTTIDGPTINLNWVWTPREPNTDHPTGRRECELVAITLRWRLFARLLHVTLEKFGGGGIELAHHYASKVTPAARRARLVQEFASALRMPFLYRSLRVELNRFTKNNFNEGVRP
jgi:hypothetical protein